MNSMDLGQYIKVTAFVFGVLFFSACEQALNYGDPNRSSEVSFSEDIALVVNDEPIPHFDIYAAAVAEGVIKEGESFDATHRDYTDVVDRLIDRVILAEAARTLDLSGSPEARRRLHIAERQVLARLYLDHVIASRVTESAIRKMYEEQVKLQQVDDSMRYSRIVMEDKPSADSAREQILMGRSFDDVAAQYSTESSWKRRNDAENFVKPNRFPAPYPEILTETPAGGVSEPFETGEGWIIVKVEERLGKAPARLDEMRPEIFEYLKHTYVDTSIANLMRRTVICYPSRLRPEDDEPICIRPASAE